MKTNQMDSREVALCGLYCGACRKYVSDKCPGCRDNEKASWCKIRACCLENGYASCAECKTHADVRACKKYENFMARLFSLVFQSDRPACIDMIKAQGYDGFVKFMAGKKQVCIKRK